MYTQIGESFGLLDSLIITIVAVCIVFSVLAIIIVITGIFSKIINHVNKKKIINPRIENKILDEDEDAVVAAIVASMDYYNEEKKNVRVVSVTRDEEA